MPPTTAITDSRPRNVNFPTVHCRGNDRHPIDVDWQDFDRPAYLVVLAVDIVDDVGDGGGVTAVVDGGVDGRDEGG